MSDYNRNAYKKKIRKKKSDKEPVLEWAGAAVGIGRAVLPWIMRGLTAYSAVSAIKGAIFGSDSDNNTTTSSGNQSVDTKKNIFQSLFGAFYGKKDTIKYGDASVFIFTIDDPTYIVENIKSRGRMYALYKRLLEKIFSKEQISGADVLAFESISTMQRSGLPIVPKSIRFYKILKRMNCLYFFYGEKCYFIFVDKNKTGIKALIRNVYTSILGDLGSKNSFAKDSSEVFSQSEKNQSSLIGKILGYDGVSSSEKINLVSSITGEKSSSGLLSSISGILGSSKGSDNNKVSEIQNIINNTAKNNQNQKNNPPQLTDEMIDNIEFPTY